MLPGALRAPPEAPTEAPGPSQASEPFRPGILRKPGQLHECYSTQELPNGTRYYAARENDEDAWTVYEVRPTGAKALGQKAKTFKAAMKMADEFHTTASRIQEARDRQGVKP